MTTTGPLTLALEECPVMEANEVIKRLGLAPHLEGGWFKETWRATTVGTSRASGTAIYYLLQGGEQSR